MRLSAPALLITGLLFAACSGSKTSTTDGGPTNGACSSARDCAGSDPTQCGGTKTCVCSNSMCIPVCSTNADCTSPQICIAAVCTNPGCGDDADCSSGQVCIGGACGAPTAASAIHSCVIAPQSATVNVGGTVQLSAVAQDASGNAVPFTGTTWAASGTNATISASGLVTGVTAGSSTVTATTGTVNCTAPVAVYGAVASGSLRVVVIDEDTKLPLSGAFVALDTATNKATTAADGSATFTITAGSTHSVHAFAANHNYASYIAVTGSDLLIPLRQFYPIPERAPFNGSINTTEFATLNEVGADVHLAFFGSSIAGSVLDFNLDDLLGQGRNVEVGPVAGQSFDIASAPGGLVLGLDQDLYTSGFDGGTAAETSTYSMYADPGPRALWGIGGNLDLSTLIGVAAPIISGGTSNLNIGTLLPQILPLLGNLEVGTVVGVEAGASGASPTGISQSVTLDTPMHMNVAIKSPNLPQYDGAYLDGVIALTGAAAFPIGFTPLGLTAGLAATDSSGNKTGAINDPTCTASATVSCATNNLPLTMAARNHGLESFPYGVVLVALNFSSLASGTGSLVLSGVVQTTNSIAFSGGTAAPTPVDLSATPFMKLPGSAGNVTYSLGSRSLSIASDADTTTQIYKFTLQASSHQTWSVYVPPAGATAETAALINPNDVDPSLVDIQATAGTGYIEAISTTSASNTYSSLTGFGGTAGVTVDALGNSLKAFAVQTVAIGQ